METQNIVFIAQSLDGYIAGKNGELDWLNSVPNPDNSDMGFVRMMNRIDALVMGRNTFETVCGFDGEWPYAKPVFVLSRSLKAIPEKFADKAELVNGSLPEVLDLLREKGHKNLYIDGGATVQNFLKEDLIEELIISTIPVLLGGGTSLFGELPGLMSFELIESQVFANQVVQSVYKRKKS